MIPLPLRLCDYILILSVDIKEYPGNLLPYTELKARNIILDSPKGSPEPLKEMIMTTYVRAVHFLRRVMYFTAMADDGVPVARRGEKTKEGVDNFLR